MLSHGTRSLYVRGCRCDRCRAANTVCIRRYRNPQAINLGLPETKRERAARRLLSRATYPLTVAERKTCRLLCAGVKEQALPAALGKSRTAVKSHLHWAFVKLGVSNVAELVAVLMLPLNSPLRRLPG